MTVAGILVGTLILLAAGLVIYNILKISVSKRIKGYGTLRAIGGEKGQLYQIIVIEVILLCLMGIPIGMLLGFLSARGILEAATGLVSPELFLVQDSSELKTLIAENSSLNGTLLILSGAITLAFALFAALPAARSAARVSPIMAMSGTNLKIRRRKRKTKKIHNFEAYYARLNLKRNKGRTAITILSLVMSITVFIALQGFSSLLNAASALQDNHVGDYQITNESIGFTTDDLNTLRKNEAVQSVAAIQFSLYEQNENGLLDEISLEFQLKPGETFQVVGLNDEYWDYFMGDQLPEEQLGQLKSGNACIVRNPIPMSYGEDVLEFTNVLIGLMQLGTRCSDGSCEAAEDLISGFSAIEAEAELVQIGLKLCAAAVISAEQECFQVADGFVQPVQVARFILFRVQLHARQVLIASVAVAFDFCTCRNSFADDLLKCFARDVFHDLHPREQRSPVFRF